ncbi:MAG TPA: hypothetical protein VN948_06530 [Terriglobales bacterium]|nr:hypothetical protein [Terriglobales bacterium]
MSSRAVASKTESVQEVLRPTSALNSEKARRFLLIPLSLLFGLCLIEFPAALNLVNYSRLVGPAAMDVFLATNKGDPELLHIHPTHSHFSGEARGGNIAANFKLPPAATTLYRWNVNYDQNGFRNELDLKSADLAVIGDSFVEETTISTAQLMTSRLAHLESKVVANLGQYGYGPLEELAVLKRYALPLHPRTVLWMFYEGNDLKDAIHYRNVTMGTHKPPSYWTKSWERSFTSNALAQVYFRLRPALRPSGIKHSGVMQTSDGNKLTVYFLYSSLPFTKEDVGALDDTTRTIATASKLCEAQGVHLIFVFIPTKFRVYHSFCQFPRESDCSEWVLNDLPDRLEKAVEAISPQIGYLDLTPNLVDAVGKGTAPYYSDDDHWTPEGQEIAAEATNNYLNK